MSKIITSQLKKWAGSVTIADPLTLPQAEAFQEGMRLPEKEKDATIYLTDIDKQRMPSILACVEKWELEGFALMPDGTIPFSPRLATHELMAWIYGEIQKVYIGESNIPNE